ncbi:uncharacterized protein isoform X4 [Choristoneura fumiferana]|uniref:uncharacterized protein isoform X4 n=1 Tax=Choristoneura fumiferana TaxID=7141 RepID=UPI003D155A5E
MEEISQFNIPLFSEEQTPMIAKSTLRICVCCLLENVPFVQLSICKHVELFDFFFKVKLEYSESMVCYGCHKLLKDLYQFRQQVQSSVMWLNNQVLEKPNNIKLKELAQSHTELTYIENSKPIQNEKLEPSIVINIPSHEIKTEIKIEPDYSDSENDVPLSEIKQKEVKIKKDAPVKNYEGKVRSVFLSEEEMLEDRMKEAMKEGYLNLPYKCESCITGFDHELTLKEHMEKRHYETDSGFVCKVCKSVLSSAASYKEHTRRHYKRIECVECGVRYNTVQSVVTHYSKTHSQIDTAYQCRDCDYSTTSHRRYRYHCAKHKEKPCCPTCGKSFVNNSALKMHMFTVHKVSNRVYSCPQCGKVYNARSGLLAHTASVHRAAAAAAYCAPCRTHFRTRHNLRHHLNTHSRHASDTDKKFACSVCGERFLTKTRLRDHVDWDHLKNGKHKCDECGKVFKNSVGLKRHLSYVHEKKRPPRDKICDYCGRGFTTLAILRAHIRTHTGARPLHCAHCAASFAHSAALHNHVKLHKGAR